MNKKWLKKKECLQEVSSIFVDEYHETKTRKSLLPSITLFNISRTTLRGKESESQKIRQHEQSLVIPKDISEPCTVALLSNLANIAGSVQLYNDSDQELRSYLGRGGGGGGGVRPGGVEYPTSG